MQPKLIPVFSHSACFPRQCLQDRRFRTFWFSFFLLDFFASVGHPVALPAAKVAGFIFNQNV